MRRYKNQIKHEIPTTYPAMTASFQCSLLIPLKTCFQGDQKIKLGRKVLIV